MLSLVLQAHIRFDIFRHVRRHESAVCWLEVRLAGARWYVAKRLHTGDGRLNGALDTSMPHLLELVDLTPVITSSDNSDTDA